MTPAQHTLAINAAAAIQSVEPAILTQDDLDALAAFVAHYAKPTSPRNKGAAHRRERVRRNVAEFRKRKAKRAEDQRS